MIDQAFLAATGAQQDHSISEYLRHLERKILALEGRLEATDARLNQWVTQADTIHDLKKKVRCGEIKLSDLMMLIKVASKGNGCEVMTKEEFDRLTECACSCHR